ncbi:MAG: hypothetical protein ACYC2O_10110, partial [Microthrixaceae bacterium]
MTEPGPPPDDGGGRDQPSPSDGEPPGPVASAHPDAPSSTTPGDDAAVIDLRTGQPAVSSGPSGAAAMPPPLPADLPIPTSPAPGLAPQRVRTRRTSEPPSVVRSLLPLLAVPLAIVLVGMVAATAVALRAASIAEQAAARSRASATTVAAAAQVDELWAGVLSLVAAGVGQEVTAEDEVRTALGSTREHAPVRVAGVAADEHRAALAAHEAFVDEVGEALDRSDAGPVE